MPTSHPHQITKVLELITTTDPKSLLDVGVGFGKYGFLTREYLDLSDQTAKGGKWSRRIDGIEGFAPYISDLQRRIYDDIHIGDALEILPRLEHRYDLALLLDVLEHFDYDGGIKLLRLVRERTRNFIVSTPIDIGVQSAVYDNVLETHRFQWRKYDLAEFTPQFFIPDEYSMICYIGEDAQRIGAQLSREHFKSRIRRMMGMRIYRFVRKALGLR